MHNIEEQMQLISSNSFVEAIARIVSSLGRPVTLGLDDGEYDDRKPRERRPLTILLDIVELERFLVAPHKWSEAEKNSGAGGLTPARMIPDLWVAIHQAGGQISRLELACLPELRDWGSDVSEGLATQDSETWRDLRIASRGLKVLKLQGITFPNEPFQRLPPASRNKMYLHKYLDVLLSDKFLDEVVLDFSLLLRLTINEFGTVIWCPEGPVLQNSCPQATKVTIRCMSLTQRELEDFFQNLSPMTENLRLSGINLLDGSWIPPLDILRARVAPRCAEGTFSLVLKNLTGAEFGQMQESAAVIEWGQPTLDGGDEADRLVAVTRYVRGDGITRNPLLEEESVLDE